MTYTSDLHVPLSQAISRDLAVLHERFYGKEPTSVRTIWTDNVIVVVMDGVLTRGETCLCTEGKFDSVRRQRQTFSDETEALVLGVVEGLIGHRVRDFLSQVSAKGEATEIFVLEGENDHVPAGTDGGDRHALALA